MKDIRPPFAQALLQEERRVTEVSVWTLAYGGGTFRFVNMEQALTVNLGDGAGTNRYEPLPFRRGTLEAQSDLQVDKLVIEMPNVELLVEYTTASQRAHLGDLVLNGVLDNAVVDIWLVNLENMGSMRHSSWDVVGTPQVDRTLVAIDLHSRMGMTLRKAPRLIVQEGCGNAIFDSICGNVFVGINPALFLVTGAATGGSRIGMTTALGNPAGWFDLGRVSFTSGPNVGAVRMVSEYLAGGAFTWSVPLRFDVAAGDQFDALPGCNKTVVMCDTKYNNQHLYRGFPNIPRPETIT